MKGKKSIRELVLQNTEVTMSIPQFCAYKRGELTLEQIVDFNRAEKQLNKWLENPKIFKQATLIVALLMLVETKVMALEQSGAIEKMRIVTERIMEVVYVVQMVGFIICLIMGLVEMIKAIVNKDTSSIISIGIKYLIGLAALFVFPWALQMVVDLLGRGGVLW